MQLFSDLGADLCGVAIDCLTAAEHNVLGANADLIDSSSQDLAGCKGIGTAELTAGDQNGLVRAAGQQLTQHSLGRRRTHGDDNDFAAGSVLELQSSLQSVQVIGVGDGGHRGTIQSTVCLDGDFAGGIRNLLYTNNCFHCKSYLPYFSRAPEMTIICTSLVPS